jgi:hypothetical protein
VGETIGLETLHAPAFVVDTNEQVGAHFFDLAAQRRQLGAVVPVAGKQDEAANQRVFARRWRSVLVRSGRQCR